MPEKFYFYSWSSVVQAVSQCCSFLSGFLDYNCCFDLHIFDLCVCVCSIISNSFMTPWTVALQAPPSVGFPRQEHWSGLPFPSPGDLPDPGIKPRFPALEDQFFTTSAAWKAPCIIYMHLCVCVCVCVCVQTHAYLCVCIYMCIFPLCSCPWYFQSVGNPQLILAGTHI